MENIKTFEEAQQFAVNYLGEGSKVSEHCQNIIESPKFGDVTLHKSYPINGQPEGWHLYIDKSTYKRGCNFETILIF